MSALPDPAAAEAMLARVRAKRGYLLPHHGLLAITAPRLLEGYDAAYTALTLEPRTLSAHDHEFVWLAILIATGEAIATHHLAKFRAAGGDERGVESALRLAAFARGAGDFRFVAEHWRRHLPGLDGERAYREALAALVAGRGVPPGLVEMAMAAVHACRAAWPELALHIVGAYREGVAEAALAEALSLVMFPGSVPNFVEAARVWRDLVRDGAVPASATLKHWAALDQGGFDGTV